MKISGYFLKFSKKAAHHCCAARITSIRKETPPVRPSGSDNEEEPYLKALAEPLRARVLKAVPEVVTPNYNIFLVKGVLSIGDIIFTFIALKGVISYEKRHSYYIGIDEIPELGITTEYMATEIHLVGML